MPVPTGLANSLLFLGHEAVMACGITPAQMVAAVAGAFRTKASGEAGTAPKLWMHAGGEASFSAKGGVLQDEGLAVVKWYGYVPHNEARGLPDFSPLVIVSCTQTGLPLAVMDGQWLSAMRTAAISTIAAGVLARPESSSAGFVACGSLAHSHLQTLHSQFPLKRIVASSRSRDSAQALTEAARALGLEARVAADASEAVRDMDIVVSSVPRQSRPRGFLDARELSPGAFAAMACMGHSWDAGSIGALDLLVTDDCDPATRLALEPVSWGGRFNADIGQLLARPDEWRPSGSTRSAAIFAGSGIADAAAAALIYRRALERGIGRPLAAGAHFKTSALRANGACT